MRGRRGILIKHYPTLSIPQAWKWGTWMCCMDSDPLSSLLFEVKLWPSGLHLQEWLASAHYTRLKNAPLNSQLPLINVVAFREELSCFSKAYNASLNNAPEKQSMNCCHYCCFWKQSCMIEQCMYPVLLLLFHMAFEKQLRAFLTLSWHKGIHYSDAVYLSFTTQSSNSLILYSTTQYLNWLWRRAVFKVLHWSEIWFIFTNTNCCLSLLWENVSLYHNVFRSQHYDMLPVPRSSCTVLDQCWILNIGTV